MKQRFVCRILFIPLLLLIGLLSSCVHEHIEAVKQTEQEPTVTFSLKVPKAAIPSPTRSLTTEEESGVSTIDVMVFGDGGENFKYTRVGKQSGGSTVVGENAQIVFEVTLPKGTFDLVVIANGRDAINAAKSNDILVEGVSKEVALGALTKALGVDEKWEETNIPMSGYKYGVDINENTKLTGDKAIAMYRMVAKVEVALSEKAAGTEGKNENFSLEELILYNYNTKGTLVPKLTDTGWDMSEPNVPDNAKVESAKFLKYTKADDPTGEYFTSDTVKNTIYTFESKNGTVSSSDKNICLVIGGKYKGGEISYYRVDFVDRKDNDKLLDLKRNHLYNFAITDVTGEGFPDPDDAYRAGPVNIEANVLQWNTADMGEVVFDGQYFLAINPIEAIHDRQEAIGEEIVLRTDYDKEKPEFSLSASGSEPNVELPDEWLSLTLPPAEENITIDKYPATKYTLKYDIKENETGEARVAYIYVKVGRLTNVMKVTQRAELDVAIWIENEEGKSIDNLDFPSNLNVQPESRTYTVNWSPADAIVSINLSSIGSEATIKWDGEKSPDNTKVLDNGLGYQKFEVLPQALTDADIDDKNIAASYTVVNYQISVEGDLASKSFMLRQFTEGVSLDIKPFYTLSGERNTITVYSSVPWKLYALRNSNKDVKEDKRVVTEVNGTPMDIIKSGTERVEIASGEINLPYGRGVNFTTEKDFGANITPSIYLGYFNLELVADDDEAVNDKRDALCASAIPQDDREANCYVLNPTTGVGLLIPVRAANGIMVDKYNNFSETITRGGKLYQPEGTDMNFTSIKSDTKFGTKLVWADKSGSNDKGLGEDALLRCVDPIGEGDKGYLLVMPGSAQAEGNAVVAVTERDGDNDSEKGEILWSWHIWITKDMKYEKGEDMQTKVMAGHNGIDPNGDLYWLDRNLGALNNGGVGNTNIDTYGLHYQWGRKDPFPNSKEIKTSTVGQSNERQLYNATGPIEMSGNHGCVNNASGRYNTVAKTITTPLTAYYGGNANNDWLHNQIHTLWGVDIKRINLGKSIFDPCPAGYRLPYSEGKPWDDSNNTRHWGNESVSISNKEGFGRPLADIRTDFGFLWPSGSIPYKGGWYTAGGIRASDGLSSTVGTSGHYWSSTPQTTSGFTLRFSSTALMPNNNNNRDFAFSVRCVAE